MAAVPTAPPAEISELDTRIAPGSGAFTVPETRGAQASPALSAMLLTVAQEAR